VDDICLFGGCVEYSAGLDDIGFFADRCASDMVVAGNNHQRLIGGQTHTQCTDAVSDGVGASHVVHANGK
jgi:hypothetical protein